MHLLGCGQPNVGVKLPLTPKRDECKRKGVVRGENYRQADHKTASRDCPLAQATIRLLRPINSRSSLRRLLSPSQLSGDQSFPSKTRAIAVHTARSSLSPAAFTLGIRMSDSDNHNVSGRDYDEGDEAGTKVPPLRREAPPSTKSTKWSTFQPTPRRTKVRYRPQPLLRMSTQRVEANLCGWWSRHCFRILAPVSWRTWLHRYAEGERLGNYAPQGELQALRPHPELKPSRLRAKQVRHAEPPPTIGVACTCRGQLVSSRALRNRTGGRRTFHH
nr:hypothetical protein Iba_chr14bCG10630 [Ipomoea batatas]